MGEKSILRYEMIPEAREHGVNRGGRYRVTNSAAPETYPFIVGHRTWTDAGNQPRPLPPLVLLGALLYNLGNSNSRVNAVETPLKKDSAQRVVKIKSNQKIKYTNV